MDLVTAIEALKAELAQKPRQESDVERLKITRRTAQEALIQEIQSALDKHQPLQAKIVASGPESAQEPQPSDGCSQPQCSDRLPMTVAEREIASHLDLL